MLMGSPCVVNTKAINSDLDEQILIYEENIHNRDMHVGYLEKIKTLYYLYQEKKARDGGAFAGSVMRRLANQLGLTMRQTRKIVRVATTPDTWISEAFSKGKLTLETCSAINGLDDSSKEELREYYDEHGDIPSELLDRFRKVKGPLIAQMEAEAKQNEEMPKGGSETGGTAFGNFMNTPEESEGKVEQPSFAPKFPEPPVTSGRFTTSPAAYTGPSTSAVTPPITPPAASSPAHQEQNDSSVPNAADILDSRPVPEKKPRPVIKNSEGKTISPEEIRLDYYSDGPYGDSSYEEDYDEMDSRKWEEEKEAKKIRDKDLQMSSDSYATASQGDDNSAMTAFIWFDEMSKRGCTETELSFIIPMLGMMEKFLIDHYVENGYIDEKAYPVLSSIVQKLTPLLS